MATLISHQKIDKAISEAISNDGLPEDRFVIIDSNVVETEPYIDIMREISNISRKMNWVKDYDQYSMRKFEYPFAYLATPLAEGMTVLDAGCSIDPFAPFLSSKGFIAQGVDNFASHDVPWDPDLGIFKGRYTGWNKVQVYAGYLKNELDIAVSYHNNDMVSTKFDDQYFDRIFCISVLEHLPRYKVGVVFDEWRRILARDGFVILTVDYVTQGEQNFNIGKVLEEGGFVLQGKVNVFGTHNLPLGDPESGFPHIIAALVVKPQAHHQVTAFSRIYRENTLVRVIIDQVYKRVSQVRRKIAKVL